MILFLDEINTNSNINGLIKEIIVDKHIEGRKILSNLVIIGACNPYKKKEKED